MGDCQSGTRFEWLSAISYTGRKLDQVVVATTNQNNQQCTK